MQSEERKELRENSLIRWMKQLRGGPSRTTIIWFCILGLGLGGWLIYRYVRNSSLQESSARAKKLYLGNANQPDKRAEVLATYAQQNPETNYALLAELGIARLELEDGLGNHLYNASTDKETIENRKKAQAKLESAIKRFQTLQGKFEDNPLLAQQCLLLAAKANEGLGQFDKANELYRAIGSRFPTSATKKIAEERLAFNEKNKEELAKLMKAINPN